VLGKEGKGSADPQAVMAAAVREAYAGGEDDEIIGPIVLVDNEDKPAGRMENGDYVIFYDIRGEREIELSQSLTDENFKGFPIKEGLKVNLVTMIEYHKQIEAKVAFPPRGELRDTLSQILAVNNLKQAKIVESEKAVHLTFFLNGEVEELMPGEERIIIPSPKGLKDYTQKPEMNIAKVTEAIIEKIEDPGCDVICANFANTDVVGHSENAEAIKRAVEAVDRHTGMVIEAAQKAGVTAIVTADHGTVEKWLYSNGTIDTGHTTSPVPFILIDPAIGTSGKVELREGGELADIAPTILELLGLSRPEAMTGRSLLQSHDAKRSKRIMLLILDGWGVSDEVEGNLIAQADTPTMDRLQQNYPATTLKASGEAVGLPTGAVGNSEAGHLHIGAGRRIYSDRVTINKAIENGSFFDNEAFLWAMRGAERDDRRLHILGIVSFYSSHGSIEYLLALLRLAKREGMKQVYIHSLLGRRGERPESGARYLEQIEGEAERLGVGRVVSVIGRYWALDREENWDRVEKAYRLLVYGEGKPVSAV